MVLWDICPIRGMNFYSDNIEIKEPRNRRERRGRKTRKQNNSRPRWKK